MTLPRQERGANELVRLLEAMDRERPGCRGDFRFTFDRELLDADQPDAMKRICNTCPLLPLCHSYAARARPTGGFWAGRWWAHKERKRP